MKATDWQIPFNRPTMVGNEERYMREALANGQISGDGPFTKRVEELLEQVTGSQRALLTTSCTHALELAALLLDLWPGDEVIVPSFTFVTTANAFALRGAKIVFCDVRPDTLNLDEKALESLVTDRTRAVVPVHYAGVSCEHDEIQAVAARRGFAVVEDNAHGLFGKYKGRALGTLGTFASLSFHETKNLTCGEGGALLINDSQYVERAEVIREKGTNRKRFFRGQVDKYTWVDLGSSYVLSDLLAAYLLAQFEKREHVQGVRKRIWHRYDEGLAGWADRNGVRRPVVPEHCHQAFHMYYVLLPSQEARSAVIQTLKQQRILSVFHYLPRHLSDMGRRFGGREGQCPVTEDVSDRLLRLPFYNSLTAEEQDRVIETVRSTPLA